MSLSVRQLFKDLFQERTRIILTILAIAWGTFAIASMLSIGEGLRLTFAKATQSAGYNLLVVTGGKTGETFRGLPANRTIQLTKRDLHTISHGLPNIQSISPEYNLSKTLEYKKNTSRTLIKAVSASYAKIHKIDIQSSGRFIKALDNYKRNAVIVLGTNTIDDLFPDEPNPIGRIVSMNGKPFTIVGAMEKKSQIVASEAPDAYYNWIPAKTYELMFNPLTVDAISITYKNPKLLEQTENQIRKIIALNHSANPNDEDIVNFQDLAAQQDTINNFFIGMEIFLGIIGTLTLLVAGVGIANVMFASIKRSTHQIGIRMAVGARTHQILRHYLIEALTVTFIGGILGLILTIILIITIRSIPMHGRLIDAIGQPQPKLSLTVLLIVILVLGLTGFLAGIFPALKATKVDPSEALRYE